jgi:NAD(P)H-dependent FMN reductase
MTDAPLLQIVIGSTRPGRAGEPVARWIEPIALAHGGFRVEIVDLAEVGLPFMDEPHHPFLREYVHQHTRDWSERVSHADAFVFVTPEYNYGISAPLKNALDFLFSEWHYKPVGVVSYGGVSGGTRGVQMLKQVLDSLRLYPVAHNVYIPFIQNLIHDGIFQPDGVTNDAAGKMLNEVARLEEALRPLRVPAMQDVSASRA